MVAKDKNVRWRWQGEDVVVKSVHERLADNTLIAPKPEPKPPSNSKGQ
jgi:hypothetical protein